MGDDVLVKCEMRLWVVFLSPVVLSMWFWFLNDLLDESSSSPCSHVGYSVSLKVQQCSSCSTCDKKLFLRMSALPCTSMLRPLVYIVTRQSGNVTLLYISAAWTLHVVWVCSQAFFALLSLPNNTAQLFPWPWHLCPHLLSASPAAPPSSHIKRKHTIIQLQRAGRHGQRPLLILLTCISISDREQRPWISVSQLHTQ